MFLFKQYKRNNGVYIYPPNYHDKLDESLEIPKENPKIENQIENNNDDVFEDEFEENLEIKKEETNQTVSIETPIVEGDTTKQESINTSEINPTNENNSDEDFFD